MTVLYSILSVFLLLTPLQDGKKFKIMSMNSNYILIDSKVLKEGDVFEEGSKVWWCFRGQSIEVMDINTSKMYKFSAVNNYVQSRGDKPVEIPLSTNDAGSVESLAEVPEHLFITYLSGNVLEKIVLNLNMDLDSIPAALSLYYYDPDTSSEILLTDDFRGLLTDLAEAHKMAKEIMLERDYYEGEEQKAIDDYMELVHKFTSLRFKKIEFTYKELKLLLNL